MRRILMLLVMLVVIGAGSAQAQNKQVSGKVTSAEDNQPIPGANVFVKEAPTIGTTADIDGNYTLRNVPADGKTLVFRFMGFTQVEMPIASTVNASLNPENQRIDEVVVTAMGISREKKSLGSAVQDIKSDELNKTSQLNVANALQGKISGVQISQAGGAVGASQRILIRGNSSFNSNDPLIVIDGVPMDGSAGGYYGSDGNGWLDTGSGLNDINPDDIENISVLKGGSAALYGMRAGNGVILVTTKKGKSRSEKMNVTYDGSFTIDKVYHLPSYQNEYGQGNSGSEYYFNYNKKEGKVPSATSYQDYVIGNYAKASSVGAGYKYVDGAGSGINDGDDESWGPRLDIGLKIPQYNSPVVDGVRQATDWVSHPNNIKDFFETGYSQSHNVSFSNSSAKGAFRTSLGYREQQGAVPNTDQRKYNASIYATYNFNKYITADGSASYNKVKSDNLMPTGYSSSNPLQSIMSWFGRQVDTKDLKANYRNVDSEGNRYNWINAFHVNPYYNLYNNTNAYERDRLISKFSLFAKPTDYLRFEGRIGYDYYYGQTFQKTLYSSDCPKGWFNETDENRKELNADFVGYFNKEMGRFNVDALVGANYRDMTWHETAMGANASTGLTVPGLYTMANVAGTPVTTMDNTHIRSNSVYANASIGYARQLYLEGSVRNDWSSTIKDDFFYPSVSLSWIPTETFKVLKNNVLSYLKIRGNMAKVGNATSAYRTGLYYSSPDVSAIGGVTQYYKPITLANPALRPENIETKEVGLEAHFLDSRIRFDFAFYDKNTSDQIMTVEVPSSVGYRYTLINAGKVNNRGAELTLSADIFRNVDGFSWTSTLNWSRDKSKVVALADNLDTYTIHSDWSVYCYAKEGESWGSLYGTGFDYDDLGRVVTVDGEPKLTKESKKIGDVTPKWLAGWSNEFSYKNFNLGFLMDYRRGGDFFCVSQMWGAYTGILDFTAATKADGTNVRETGVIVGKDVLTDKTCVNSNGGENTDVISAQDWFYSYYFNKEMNVCDGSFLKLREVHLTYTLPKNLISKIKFIEDAKLSLIGSNVAILWLSSKNQAKIDPESSQGSGNISVGFESNSCPPTRSLGVKLSVTF